jgi:polygalacturonase
VHEVERVELHDNQTLYVEEGTVLRTVVRAENARNIKVAGRGIIDGVNSRRATDTSRLMLFRNCHDIEISGVTLINPASWMVVLTQCNRVHIDGIREIGVNVCSDGIDVVASSDVLIENTFQRNNDDCVVIKGFGYDKTISGGNVENVLVRNCVLLNAQAGNVMEIGYETRCDRIHNITFRDIDVIGAHGEGGVFTIHNAEQAEVSTVLYEDIRVENFYDRLIDFRIFHSRYSRQNQRGRIRDITLRHIRTVADRHNTLSIIGGHDSDHLVERVTIEDFVMGDQRIENEDQLHLFTRWARDVVFR